MTLFVFSRKFLEILAVCVFLSPVVVTDVLPPWAPETYPDGEGFTQRREILIAGVADSDLGSWRRGYFTGGDPGKYLPAHAMAKLLVNPDDPEPGRYMNDDRSYREHYHFAALNWSRFYPMFGEKVLTDETREKYAAQMRRANYLTPSGTENHKTQWWTSAKELPHYTGSGTNHLGKEETLKRAGETLRTYTRSLFEAGKGEWDSSTYLMFDAHGLLNIFDFSPDEEAKRIAQAALDWKIAAYALKYTDGIFTAPNQRGFASAPYSSIADQTGYLWWGGSKELTPADTRGFRYAIHAATSSWLPGRVISNIALRNIEGLPVEQRNTKPNYWHGLNLTPQAGNSHETVYIDQRFTMGSLWNAHNSQHSRFQVVVSGSEGGVAFTGGHPRRSDHNNNKTGIGFADGNGRFLQSVQSGPVYLAMARAPESEEHDYTFFRTTSDLEPRALGLWRVYDVEGVHVAVRPLSDKVEPGDTPEDPRGNRQPILKFPGRNSGFVVWVLETADDLEDKLAEVQVDAADFEEAGTVSVQVPGVVQIEARFNPHPETDLHGNRAAHAVINGEEVDLNTWKIYGGPLLTQTPGVLTVSDGRESFKIDFTGDLPVYEVLP